jgi:hypothetical protein
VTNSPARALLPGQVFITRKLLVSNVAICHFLGLLRYGGNIIDPSIPNDKAYWLYWGKILTGKGLTFTKLLFGAKIKCDFGRLAQWLERLLHTQEVTGSSPVPPICRSGGMADALRSGRSARKGVGVQISPSAPLIGRL